jgi:hypothetical protein
VKKNLEFIQFEKHEANSPKSDLMQIQGGLEAEGYFKEAEALGKIIARLETWQNK